jgi:hypothetical protein
VSLILDEFHNIPQADSVLLITVRYATFKTKIFMAMESEDLFRPDPDEPPDPIMLPPLQPNCLHDVESTKH